MTLLIPLLLFILELSSCPLLYDDPMLSRKLLDILSNFESQHLNSVNEDLAFISRLTEIERLDSDIFGVTLRGAILHALNAQIAYNDGDAEKVVSELCASCDHLDSLNPTFVDEFLWCRSDAISILRNQGRVNESEGLLEQTLNSPFFYKHLWYRFRNETGTQRFSVVPSLSANIAFWHLLHVLYLHFSLSTDTLKLLHHLSQTPSQSQLSLQLTVVAMDAVSHCQYSEQCYRSLLRHLQSTLPAKTESLQIIQYYEEQCLFVLLKSKSIFKSVSSNHSIITLENLYHWSVRILNSDQFSFVMLLVILFGLLVVLYAGSRNDGIHVERVKALPIREESQSSLQNGNPVNLQKGSVDANCVVRTPRVSKSSKKKPLKVSADYSPRVRSCAPVCVRFSVIAQDVKGDVFLIMDTVPQAVDKDGIETIQLPKRRVCGWRMMKENEMCWSRMLTMNIGIKKNKGLKRFVYQYAVSLDNGEWFVSEGLKRDLTQVVMGTEGGSISLTCDELILPEENEEESLDCIHENSVDSLSIMSISTSVGTEIESVSCLEFEKEKPEIIASDVSLTPLSVSPDPLPVKSSESSPSPLPPFTSDMKASSFASDSPSESFSRSSLRSIPYSTAKTLSTSNSTTNTPFPSIADPPIASTSESEESQNCPLSQHSSMSPRKGYEVGIALSDMTPIPILQKSEHPLVLTTRRSKRSPKETTRFSSVSAAASPFMYPVMNYPVMGYMPQTPMMMCVMAPNGQLMWIPSPVQPFPISMPENPSEDLNKYHVC